MPRKNSNARPRPKRRSLRALAKLVTPVAPLAKANNERFYAVGSKLDPPKDSAKK